MAYGVGASLVSLGQNQLKQATQELGVAANQESARNAENKTNEALALALLKLAGQEGDEKAVDAMRSSVNDRVAGFSRILAPRLDGVG